MEGATGAKIRAARAALQGRVDASFFCVAAGQAARAVREERGQSFSSAPRGAVWCLLAGFGAQVLIERVVTQGVVTQGVVGWKRPLASMGLCLLIPIFFWIQGDRPFHANHTPLTHPISDYEAIGTLEGEVVLMPPLNPKIANTQLPLLFQLSHQKRLLTGHGMWVDRVRPESWDDFQRLDFHDDAFARPRRDLFPYLTDQKKPEDFPFSGIELYSDEVDWAGLDKPESEFDDARAAQYGIDFLKNHEGDPFFLACGFFRPHMM